MKYSSKINSVQRLIFTAILLTLVLAQIETLIFGSSSSVLKGIARISPSLWHYDGVSTVFISILILVTFLISLGSFWDSAQIKSNKYIASGAYILLILSIFLVILADSFQLFLWLWEIMSLSSFIVLIFENNTEKKIKPAIKYLIYMHISFVSLMVSSIVIENQANITSFSDFFRFDTAKCSILWVLLMAIGFATKAGIVPFHSWVEDTYQATAGSNSIVFTGIVSKMGILGLIRITLALQDDLYMMSFIFLLIGIASGLYAVIHASLQKNIKSALAYSSIENMSLVLVGIGLGLLGKSVQNMQLSILGFSAAILHTVNHALYKPSLFIAANMVEEKYGTDRLDLLGGVIHKFPMLTTFFLVSSVAVCALPPLNGFFSEYLMLIAATGELNSGNITIDIFMLAILFGLSMIGGISIFLYLKLVGIAFLGKKRSDIQSTKSHINSTVIAQLSMLTLGMVIVSAFAPRIIIAIQTSLWQIDELQLQQMGSIHTNYFSLHIAFIFLLLCIGVFYLVKNRHVKNVGTAEVDIWGCGYPMTSANMQYTGTSFSESLEKIVEPIIHIKQIYNRFKRDNYFPNKQSFFTVLKDKIESKVINQWVYNGIDFLKQFAVLQTGHSQRYVLYAFLYILLLGILSFLNWI